MTTNIYLKSVKMSIKSVKALHKILIKAQEWIATENKNEAEILDSKLAPDMFPLTKQVQMVSDNLKGMASRLAGVEAPVMEDNETTLAELITRLEKTIEFVESIDEAKYDEANTQKIVMSYIPGKFQDALDYLTDFAVPNLYFHVVAAYLILRNQGLNIGKMDYIHSLNLQDL